MARIAIIDENTNIVINAIEAGSDFRPQPGTYLRPGETANPGDLWNGSTFEKPPQEPVVQYYTTAELEALTEAANTTIALRNVVKLLAKALDGRVPK